MSNKTTVKFEAVCESGNTDADTVVRMPDRESAELYCRIWRDKHPGADAYVRETQCRPMSDPLLGDSVMVVTISG